MRTTDMSLKVFVNLESERLALGMLFTAIFGLRRVYLLHANGSSANIGQLSLWAA
jgi:hypothetical protein